uniref:ERCC4 domain-containing protein n=1 Tax=Aureoumbra lagunensis TaxID=44058 RepID=A0A7S3JS39_9STRA|mmetsp:Transcript_17969/g.27032  ORF Transcript_17969/g.27032 Transcript_17969/m.27032 type:complete len:911 (-) Transcript_17969:303-3035(-)
MECKDISKGKEVMEPYLRLVCQETWDDHVDKNILLVMAQGLGLVDVLALALKKNMSIAVLNVSKEIEIQLSIRCVRGETYSKEQRKKIYSTKKEKIFFFASSRMFAIDALENTLDLSTLDGIVILDAHRCASESSTENLAIQIFRDRQPNGWVKGFCEDADACVRGFNKLTKIVRTLGSTRVMLWPRFEAQVNQYLNKRPAQSEIILAEPTILMRSAQVACIQAMIAASMELKRVTAVRTQSFHSIPSERVDNQIVCGCDSDDIGKYYEDPLERSENILNAANLATATSPKARRLALELRTLRDLLLSLHRLDAVAFYDAVLSVRELLISSQKSDWVQETLCIDELVAAARDRCLPRHNSDDKENSMPEQAPKWAVIANILADLNKNTQNSGISLIVCKEDIEAKALIDYLVPVPQPQYIQRLHRINKIARERLPNKRSAGQRDALLAEEHFTKEAVALFQQKKIQNNMILDGRRILIVSHDQWRKRLDPLGDYRPDAIILNDAEPHIFRQIERYQARRHGIVRLYLITVARTVDSKQFNRMVERETAAFVKLIKEKSSLLIRTPEPKKENIHGGDKNISKASQIIVDSREFRAKLPIALYNAGVQLRPATIRVGDYILTPDIVVERKSLVDFVGSLASGRLATQTENMQRLYQTPILLLETESSVFGTRALPSDRRSQQHGLSNKLFSESEYDSLPTTNTTEARLVLLVLHYPRLRILWCNDDRSAIKLFAALKKGNRQPKLDEKCEHFGNPLQQQIDDGRNLTAIDLLLKLPGITEANIGNIIEHVDSLKELVNLEFEALEPLLGSKNAKLLLSFLSEHDASRLKPAENVTSVRYLKPSAKPTFRKRVSKKKDNEKTTKKHKKTTPSSDAVVSSSTTAVFQKSTPQNADDNDLYPEDFVDMNDDMLPS